MSLNPSQRAALLVAALATVRLGLYVYVNTLGYYEFHRDEFLYFAMGEHLRLFGMDFPPFIAILSETVRGLFGDSLLSIHLVPTLAGLGLMVVAALAARELGGQVFAQGLAALAVLCSVLYLRASNLYQPVVFDQLWWSLALFCLIKLGAGPRPRWWLTFGIVFGLGLLTKFSILILGFATFVALVLTTSRADLKTKWPWIAAALAVIIGSPSIIGQIALGWPVFGQMEAIGVQFENVSYLGFIAEQPKMVGGFLLAVVGSAVLIRGSFGNRLRVVGLAPAVAFLVLMLLHGKAYYIGPIYPVLFGAGAVAFERIRHAWAGPLVRWGTVVFLVVYTGALLPLGLPILKPVDMEAYLVRMGLQEAATTNIGDQERIPQDYADMLNWKQQVETVARVFHGLPAEEQSKVVIIASNYGEAGAIDFYGPRLGIPTALATVGTYWTFGPGDLAGDVVVTIGVEQEALRTYYSHVTPMATVKDPFAVDEERSLEILVGRGPLQTLQEIWPSFEGNH